MSPLDWQQVTWHMALLPVLVLLSLHQSGAKRDVAYWWIAGAFAVSWVADALAHVVDPHVTTLCYPIVQSAIIGAVLLRQREGRQFVYVSVLCGLFAIVFLPSYDVLLRTVAWSAVTVMAMQARRQIGLTSLALTTSFGVGLVSWYLYNLTPSFETWAVYQAVRALGLFIFCAACCARVPVLRVQAT